MMQTTTTIYAPKKRYYLVKDRQVRKYGKLYRKIKEETAKVVP